MESHNPEQEINPYQYSFLSPPFKIPAYVLVREAASAANLETLVAWSLKVVKEPRVFKWQQSNRSACRNGKNYQRNLRNPRFPFREWDANKINFLLKRETAPPHLPFIRTFHTNLSLQLYTPPQQIHPKPAANTTPTNHSPDLDINLSTQDTNSSTAPKINPKYTLYSLEMENFSAEDELLIQKFIGLTTEDGEGQSTQIPHSATSSTAWDMCLLARVVSDKTVVDAHFTDAMLKAWGADPNTVIRQVARNSYLIEFCTEDDLHKANHAGPWTFRGDLVATKRVSSHLDINPDSIEFASLWVQFYDLPVYSLSEEGYDILGRQVGTPVSTPIEGFVNGRRFVKMKVIIELAKPLKDKVSLTHPNLGELKVLCVYEKITRVCRFCGALGHEMVNCPDFQRLSVLAQMPATRARIMQHNLLSPKLGAWIANPLLIPRAQSKQGRQNNSHKRALSPEELHDFSLGPPGFGNRNVKVTVNPSDAVNDSTMSVKRPRPAGPYPLDRDI